MRAGSTLLAVMALLASANCLRGNKSDACVILEDCLCGDTVEEGRSLCVGGLNDLNLAIRLEGQDLSEDQCQTVVHQLGDECPHGDLSVAVLEPNPERLCIHDKDCDETVCDCEGSAAWSVTIRGCLDGVCLDPLEECNDRCLWARMVRGDACQMLQRCRCAPLLPQPRLDSDSNGLADLDECLQSLPRGRGEDCEVEASRTAGPSAIGLPRTACPDAAEFISEP
jgi:hypothetical protein